MLNDTQLANRVKWVRALRSGEFKQGRDRLKKVWSDGPEYCCLGVACELVDPTNDLLRIHEGSHSSVGTSMDDIFAERHFGMSHDDQNAAIGWNDTEERSFKRIADLIAFATENDLSFADAETQKVRVGYSATWLERFN